MDFLCSDRHRKLFSRRLPSRDDPAGSCARVFVLRFACLSRETTYNAQRSANPIVFADTVTTAVHRFEECIGGRPYLIEVAPVSDDRWRAYIVRLPGVPTALMPFYGSTPVEAARQLSDWLTRAYQRAADAAGTV